jgi:hypothetical protein
MFQRLLYNKKNRRQLVDCMNVATLVLMLCTILVKMATLAVISYKIYHYNQTNETLT